MAKLITKNFDCVSDYVRFCETAKPAPGCDQPSRTVDFGFSGTNSFEEAARLSVAGWAEGAQRVASLREKCSAFVAAAKAAKTRGYGWDVTGDFIDVGRYLTGEPECFGSEEDFGGQISSKVVSIRLNTCVSGSVSKEAITARGLAVLVATDILESCGIRCEILVSLAGEEKHCHRRVEANVAVKSAGEPVDIDRLAFTLCHPSWLRRLGFAFQEHYGNSPNHTKPYRLSDHGKRENTIEINEVCTASGLNDDELQADVLKIAKACGLEFSDEELAEITA